MIRWAKAVQCDVCGFASKQFSLFTREFDDYLREGPDGRWLAFETQGERHICRGCIIDRACRIFGHSYVRPLAERSLCTRCQAFRVVAS